jgi:amino acid permease
LQDERALDVHATVQATGELKMAMPDSSGGFKDAQQFFS